MGSVASLTLGARCVVGHLQWAGLLCVCVGSCVVVVRACDVGTPRGRVVHCLGACA